MKMIILLIALIGPQMVAAETNTTEGWQFLNFFGNYTVVSNSTACTKLSGTVSIGYKHTTKFPSIEIRSKFSTDDVFFMYLRNTNTHGEDCYECDPGWWETEVVGGDGIQNATFQQKGITPYSNSPYSETLEIVKSNDDRFFLKWNACSAELKKIVETDT